MTNLTGASLLHYFGQVRERTMRLVRCIPADQLEWTCRSGQFTLGDLARHIATTERYVFCESIRGGQNRYPGCGKELADGLDKVVALMEKLHAESMELFSAFTEEDWNTKCVTPDAAPIARWKFLRAMIEYEVHHRGQIYTYLGILGVPAPSLFGLTEDQLAQRAKAG